MLTPLFGMLEFELCLWFGVVEVPLALLQEEIEILLGNAGELAHMACRLAPEVLVTFSERR